MRRAAALAALALGGCGGDDPAPGGDPFEQLARDRPATATSDRAAPRWEPLATLRGAGTAAGEAVVDERAVQWRARWRCSGEGRFALEVEPPPPRGNPLDDGRCPGRGDAEAAGTGRVRVRARGSGALRVVVEQQVTTPLREPPLEAMEAPGARVVGRGRFTRIDRRGTGRALLHRLPGGRLALRFEDFETVANIDLFVWISPAPRPRTSRAALEAPHRVVAPLKATVGDHNYLLPRGTRVRDVRSIVIWCAPLRFAYVAAAVEPA